MNYYLEANPFKKVIKQKLGVGDQTRRSVPKKNPISNHEHVSI